MAFMLRQVLQKRSSKLVTNHSVVGKKVDAKEETSQEYDFIIVGGGRLLLFGPFALFLTVYNFHQALLGVFWPRA